MRFLTALSKFLEWTGTVYFGVPLLISLAVSLVLCMTAGTSTDYFPLKVLLSLSRDMLSFLGVIAAILIAVFTTTYVLSSQNRREGFLSFLQALNRIRRVPLEIENSRDVIDPGTSGSSDYWSDLTREFIERMNEVKPVWGGFDTDPELEDVMFLYVNCSKQVRDDMISNLGNSENNKSEVRRLYNRIDESVRGMLDGLLSMEFGIVGRQFAVTLMKLSFSLAILLIATLVVRALVEPFTGVGSGWWTWLSLSAYLFLPINGVIHVLGLICATHEWWQGVRRREKPWEDNRNLSG